MNTPPEATILSVARGSTRDAWLLRRIIFWFRYARVEHGGYVWIVKTQDEWSAETGLPLRSVQRACESLRDKGVIATEQHLFGTKAPNYLRLLPRALAALGLKKKKRR